MSVLRDGAPKAAAIPGVPPLSRPFGTSLTRPVSYLAGIATLFLFVVLLGALTWRTAQYLVEAWRAINFPFALDWMEGAVWQQAVLIPGPRMYGPVDAPPYLFFEYPLVYHLAVNALAAFGGDPLQIGRALSVACALVIAGLCGILVHRAMRHAVGRPARAFGATIAALAPLTYHPVTSWSQQMRVDMLAVALSFAGVTLAVFAARRPVLLWPAAAAFVLAIYTKQVEIAAPAAALAVALMLNRRQAMRAALFGLALAATALLALEWMTGGGFLRHIVSYNADPSFSLGTALAFTAHVYLDHGVYFALALTGLAILWMREIRSTRIRTGLDKDGVRKFAGPAAFLRESDLRIVLAVGSLWFLLSSGMLVTSGQIGANENHFIEAMCVWAIPIGMLTALAVDQAFERRRATNRSLACGLASLLALALLFQVRCLGPRQYGQLRDPAFSAASERLIDEARRATRPVYSEDMVIAMRSGHGIAVEPPGLQLIYLPGGWNGAAAFVRMIEERQFAFLILQYESEYPDDVISRIRDRYPVTERVGPYVVHRPRPL